MELDQIPNNNLRNIQGDDDEEEDSGKEYEEDDGMVDVNDVKIIDAGEDYDEDDDSQKRPLNRHEENLADEYQDNDDGALNQLHDQLQILDQEDEDQQHVIDDQNFGMDMHGHEEDEDDDQQYGGEEADDDMMQLENEMQQQMMGDDDFDEFGPELLKQAQEMGLDEDELRQLVQQQMHQELNEDGEDEEPEESNA